MAKWLITSSHNPESQVRVPPGKFNFCSFLLIIKSGSYKYKRYKCSSSVTNILVVLGAVAQCLETVIASSNPGSCTEGLGHYGLGTAPFLPYFQYKPVRAAEWIHRGQFLFGSRLSSTPWPFG